jgi:hypothetical protein
MSYLRRETMILARLGTAVHISTKRQHLSLAACRLSGFRRATISMLV